MDSPFSAEVQDSLLVSQRLLTSEYRCNIKTLTRHPLHLYTVSSFEAAYKPRWKWHWRKFTQFQIETVKQKGEETVRGYNSNENSMLESLRALSFEVPCGRGEELLNLFKGMTRTCPGKFRAKVGNTNGSGGGKCVVLICMWRNCQGRFF